MDSKNQHPLKDGDLEAKIDAAYTDPGNAGGFAGEEPLWREVRRRYPQITRKQVRDYLQGSRTYTLFRPKREKFPRLRTIPTGYLSGKFTIFIIFPLFHSDLQVDLADFQKLAHKNAGYKYLLLGVDVLSCRFFGAPVKSKSPTHMKEAFERMFAQMDRLPGRIYSDQGLEFESSAMKKYFEELGIDKLRTASKTRLKAGVTERGIREFFGIFRNLGFIR